MHTPGQILLQHDTVTHRAVRHIRVSTELGREKGAQGGRRRMLDQGSKAQLHFDRVGEAHSSDQVYTKMSTQNWQQ